MRRLKRYNERTTAMAAFSNPRPPTHNITHGTDLPRPTFITARALGGEGSGKLAACGFQEALDVLESVHKRACDNRLAAKVRQHILL